MKLAGLFWLAAIIIGALVELALTSTFGPIAAKTEDYSDWVVVNQQPAGDLYALWDAVEGTGNISDLMLKDVCEDTVRAYGDGSKRFSCVLVDTATCDAYLSTLDLAERERTFKAWREGR
jgi:hypothetical protein